MAMKMESGPGGAVVLLPEDYVKASRPFPAIYLVGGDLRSERQEILAAYRQYALSRRDALCQPAAVLVQLPAAESARDFTPWPAASLYAGEAPFAGQADAFLSETVLPLKAQIEQNYHVESRAAGAALLGYSLAGLFCLYALFRTPCFGAAGSMSGSLWYEGWPAFLDTHTPLSDAPRIYLSLGRKEKERGSRRMRTVEANTQKTYAYFLAHGGDETRVSLALQPGGHFHQIAARYGAALYALSTGMTADLAAKPVQSEKG